MIQFYPLPRPWMPRLGENFPRCLAAGPWEAAPMAQIDTFDMMTSAQQRPTEHFRRLFIRFLSSAPAAL